MVTSKRRDSEIKEETFYPCCTYDVPGTARPLPITSISVVVPDTLTLYSSTGERERPTEDETGFVRNKGDRSLSGEE